MRNDLSILVLLILPGLSTEKKCVRIIFSAELEAILTSILRNSVHFASSDGRGPIFRIFGAGMSDNVVNAQDERRDEVTRCIRWRALTDTCCIDVEICGNEWYWFVNGDVETKFGALVPQTSAREPYVLL